MLSRKAEKKQSNKAGNRTNPSCLVVQSSPPPPLSLSTPPPSLSLCTLNLPLLCPPSPPPPFFLPCLHLLFSLLPLPPFLFSFCFELTMFAYLADRLIDYSSPAALATRSGGYSVLVASWLLKVPAKCLRDRPALMDFMDCDYRHSLNSQCWAER